MYVESTIAHNTVQVDGRDIERRSRHPYGSGLGKCTKVDGRFIIRGEAEHGSYLHERMLRYEPGRLLEVIDIVSPQTDEIEAVSWFNINGEFQAVVEGNTILFHAPDGEFVLRANSECELIMPVRGQQSPMRGWRSKVDRELVPVWNFGYRHTSGSRKQHLVSFEIVNSVEGNQ